MERFVVAENFKVGNIVGGRPIGFVGPDFRQHFGDVVEENVPARTLYIWEFVKNSLDAPVIKIFDNGIDENPKTETHLAHMFQMMELGEQGKGMLDDCTNFGYKLSPQDELLWVPYWFVRSGKFRVEATVASYPGCGESEWDSGVRVSGG